MWPFTKKTNLPSGFEMDNQGNVMFELTEEENQEVQKLFDMTNNPDGALYVKKEAADEVQRSLIAMGLFNYAKGQITLSELDSNKSKKKGFIDKAVDSITKAYSFCQLPIYLYDLACFIEMGGKNEVAKNAFKGFLELQRNFKPSQIQEALLNASRRDVNKALKHAEEKIK